MVVFETDAWKKDPGRPTTTTVTVPWALTPRQAASTPSQQLKGGRCYWFSFSRRGPWGWAWALTLESSPTPFSHTLCWPQSCWLPLLPLQPRRSLSVDSLEPHSLSHLCACLRKRPKSSRFPLPGQVVRAPFCLSSFSVGTSFLDRPLWNSSLLPSLPQSWAP